jgi:hypothetical protein
VIFARLASRSRLQSLLQEILGIGSTPRARRFAESHASNGVLNPPGRSCLPFPTALIDENLEQIAQVVSSLNEGCRRSGCFMHWLQLL